MGQAFVTGFHYTYENSMIRPIYPKYVEKHSSPHPDANYKRAIYLPLKYPLKGLSIFPLLVNISNSRHTHWCQLSSILPWQLGGKTALWFKGMGSGQRLLGLNLALPCIT